MLTHNNLSFQEPADTNTISYNTIAKCVERKINPSQWRVDMTGETED